MEKAKIRPLATPKPLNRSPLKFWGWLDFTFVFQFFHKATAYTLERIFTHNTSEEVVPGKEVPLEGIDNYTWFLDH